MRTVAVAFGMNTCCSTLRWRPSVAFYGFRTCFDYEGISRGTPHASHHRVITIVRHFHVGPWRLQGPAATSPGGRAAPAAPAAGDRAPAFEFRFRLRPDRHGHGRGP